MGIQRRSLLIYVDTSPASIGVYVASQPPQMVYQSFTDTVAIAVAEIAAALFALIWCGCLRQPTAITLATDSAVTYYVLSTGKGSTIRYNTWLQCIFVKWFEIKVNRGHSLVVHWVPSQANLAEPVSRDVLPTSQQAI
jgi:ribonuclease HI